MWHPLFHLFIVLEYMKQFQIMFCVTIASTLSVLSSSKLLKKSSTKLIYRRNLEASSASNIRLQNLKEKCNQWVEETLYGNRKYTYTQLGSVSYLFFGKKASMQSIHIKMGRLGEFMAKEMVRSNPSLELLDCGLYHFERKKDVDLIFKCEKSKTIYYRELKGNLNLDTEKFPATIQKCIYVKENLQSLYKGYHIDSGIFHWTVYNPEDVVFLANQRNYYKRHYIELDAKGLCVDFMKDFLPIVGLHWEEKNYYNFFRNIGGKIENDFGS